MQVVFVGGAQGVGASCLAIELGDVWFVVDAGVRVDRKADPLPDLALLEGKDVRAIFVTHAHADHIGSLPLVHQAFPNVPIFASRGTALLMEVMLADALKIMNKRAVEEMELPLYPESLVAGMLNRVRTLPIGQSVSLGELPGVRVSASRAGHIAGAVSLAFAAVDGTVVVSGDISITPQRTVLGAVAPSVERCDLLVLESTYGSRLHPNRQSEELRLAQAVADGLADGGHVLIPSFGLGRGQELLLLLQAAQEKGQIPDFPIYVDGLVRRVCNTYLLLPEALSPVLQRQIRKGYLPFSGSNVTFVRDERERERILAGPPACIITSSGMLTGGPSAWYATRLVSQPNASILITGYQDEESPGKRLLDVAEQKKDTLELGGQQVQVQCRVAKYSLSAHADGGELAAYATTLNPHRVALVHGDDEARAALRTRLEGTEVLLPANGETIAAEQKSRRRATGKAQVASQQEAEKLESLPVGIGAGVPFDYQQVEQLWRAVTQVATLRIVTARELALVWYGEATEETTENILETLLSDYEQRYFVPQHALEEAFRVRGQYEETPSDFLSDLVGSVLLLLVSPESAKPVICRAIEPGAAVRVQLPKGVSQERIRFPFSAIFELLGPAPQYIQQSPQKASTYLHELVKTMRRIRRSLSAHSLAEQCQEGALYTLSELCDLAGLSPHSLEDRLALAKLLHLNPGLFSQERTVFDGEGLPLYGLSPEWRETLEEPEEQERPDQNWILSVIEQYIGTPSDLYRRSVDPDTGDVTLSFHFPDVAQQHYADLLAAAAEETGVTISLAPHAHQGALTQAAYDVVPEGLTVQKAPSIYHASHQVILKSLGQVSPEALTEAQARFHETTGWYLTFEGVTVLTSRYGTGAGKQHSADGRGDGNGQVNNTGHEATPDVVEAPLTVALSSPAQPALAQSLAAQSRVKKALSQYDAVRFAQILLGTLPGYYKVGAANTTTTLWLRFHFPTVAERRYADVFKQLEAQTGWHVQLYPGVHQEALLETACRLLPPGLHVVGKASLHQDRSLLRVHCTGQASEEEKEEAQRQFVEETGWEMELLV
ncbi:MAG TPA: MBL fold metallo-hydrolase [Ktedonobacteraceae bacterium]|nr:MBL fold metallo-hydrolase [Ktedonobacteraceae bacterium]